MVQGLIALPTLDAGCYPCGDAGAAQAPDGPGAYVWTPGDEPSAQLELLVRRLSAMLGIPFSFYPDPNFATAALAVQAALSNRCRIPDNAILRNFAVNGPYGVDSVFSGVRSLMQQYCRELIPDAWIEGMPRELPPAITTTAPPEAPPEPPPEPPEVTSVPTTAVVPREPKPFPWGYALGGAGFLIVGGVAVYLITRKKRRRNPARRRRRARSSSPRRRAPRRRNETRMPVAASVRTGDPRSASSAFARRLAGGGVAARTYQIGPARYAVVADDAQAVIFQSDKTASSKRRNPKRAKAASSKRRNPKRAKAASSRRRNPKRRNPTSTSTQLERQRRRLNPLRSRARSSSSGPKATKKRRNLAESTRERLPARDFAIPDRRVYPIQSKAQARRALVYADWPQNRKDRDRVRRAVFSRYPSLRRESRK